jgi:phospholipid/cholesterol/gamma-HCH transport system permease protein
MKLLAVDRLSEWIEGLGRVMLLGRDAAAAILARRLTWQDFVYQLYFVGVTSQLVVLITGAFTGMVLSTQTYFQFHQVKMETATLAVVSVAMCSELGAVLTGLMVAGRVGASIAAELGTMRVTEQIDALRTLATHPVDYLVAPRMLALLVAMPVLAVEAIAVGIGAGHLAGTVLLGIDPVFSWHNMLHYTQVGDLAMGVLKAGVFGGLVGLIGCYKGMTCSEGAEGVGHATTEAVVYASIAILIVNFFITLGLGNWFHSL